MGGSVGLGMYNANVPLMKQFYQLSDSEKINIALSAERDRASERHQQTLIRLRLLASII